MAVPPNRMLAYQQARAAEGPQRGLTYSELLLDNILGLDNEYQSFGETLGQQINADELGFLKNAGIAAYQGAKEAVLNPIDTVVGLATELYDAGAGLATEDLNDRLLEMYGVGYDQATDEEINRARESVLGDAMTVGSVVPVAKPLERAARAAADAVDAAQLAQYARFRAENMRPEFSPAGAANQRFYYPSREERFQMENTPTETQKIYLQQEAEADRLLREGADPRTVARQTGMIPVPLRTPDGRDEGYRLVASLNPEDWTAYRPRSNLNVDIEEVLFPRDIRKTVTGMVAPSDFEGATDRDFTVSLNSEMPKSLYPRILIHEGEHLDMFESDISAPEVGSNAPEAFNDKRALLRTMDDQIRAATDEAQRAELMRRRDALAGMTSMELYYNNPGEMLARLSEGNTESAKRLSPSEAFNPYLSNRGLARRGLDALLTSVFSELAPVGGALRRTLGPRVTPLPPFIRNVPTTFDRYVSVPMDMNRALITDPKYVPSNPAGVVRPNEAPDTFDYDPMAIIDPFDEPLAPPARPSAVIRRDDVFRGHGNMGLSYMENRTLDDVAGKYAVRTTKDDQIEDMIASGLIRPKPEGYGKAQGSTIYMGLSDTPTVRVGPMEGMLSNSSRYALVGKADEIAKYDEAGGVPLDALQHIWYRQPDDTIVDILPEILRKNQDFGSQNFNNGGPVGGASFFSLDGQERRRALDNLDQTAMEYLQYFLGPTGIPDRLAAVSQAVDAMSPVSGTLRSMEAAGEGRYLDSALEGAGVVAPAGIAAYLARAGRVAAPYVAGAVDEGEAALRAMFGAPENSSLTLYHGSPHNFPAERLVRMPDGSTQYIVGAPDQLPKVPEGAELLQDFPMGRARLDKVGTGSGAQAYGHGIYAGDAEKAARRFSSEGRMYEMEIPASADDFIDYDVPLQEQSQKVRDFLSDLVDRGISTSPRQALSEAFTSGEKGRAIAEEAAKAGIAGNKFRGDVPGTHNYVLMNENLISIVRKYGIAGAAAVLGVSAAEVEQALTDSDRLSVQNFNNGGVVAGAPNRMAAYQMATRPAAPVTSILDYDPEYFVAALDELGVTGEERAALEQQYFARNRALPMTERPENMRIGTVAPIAFPEGMTGAEALMSGNFEFTAPELVRGLYEGPAEAFNVVNAMLNGVPVTQQQMQESATGVAGTITGIGPARAGVRAGVRAPRGIESLQPNVVSMSGVRGMGDNGGPALEQFDENGFLRLDDIPAGPPRRFINRNTGLYSPSFEAAKNLPQEVGTPQQMRAALLNSGAKEEELIYSGFDDWLRGKERVTKQEIEDVLGEAAAGQSGNMPYVRVSNAANAGVTGVHNLSLSRLQDRLLQDLRRQAIDERNAQMESELQSRGYRPIRFADENEYRQMADRVRALYNNPQSRGGLGPDGERLPPGRIMNAITQIDSLVQRQGRSFDDPEVQRILSSLADDYDYILGPSGLPEFTDDVIRQELPDFAANPYFGSLPMTTVDEIFDRVYGMSQQEVADQLGVSVEEMLDNFDPGPSEYGNYVVPGMRNYSENQYMFDDTGRGVLSGIERLGVRPFEQQHFNAGKKPLMFFTLTGELNTPEGPAYNLAQIQSDIGQAYNDTPDRFFVPGSTPTTLEIPKPQKAALRSYVDRAKEVADLERQVGEKLDILYENYLSPETGALMKDAPGYREASDEIISLRQAAMQTRDELLQFEADNNDLFRKIGDFYGGVRTFSDTMGFGGDVTTERFEDILSGTANPKSGYGLVGKTASLPFATSTNRWLDAAFKSELVNAAKAGAEWITIPKGDDVQRYTGGDLAGQRKFYGGPDDKGIAVMRLKNLAKKLIPFETEFKDFEATGFGPNPPTYNVSGMRLTPEIRKYILENGLPSFAKGGPVDGSSLDVDVFALG